MSQPKQSLSQTSNSGEDFSVLPKSTESLGIGSVDSEIETETKEKQPAVVRRRPWAVIRLLVTLAIGLGLLAWLLWRVSLGEVVQALSHVKYPLLVLGIVGHLFTPFLRAERFRHLYGITGRRFELTGLMGQYGLLNLLLPLRTGDVALLGMLKVRQAIPSIAEALPRWIVLRCGDLAAVLTLVLLTALAVPFHASLTPWVRATQVAMGLLVLGGISALLVLRSLPKPEERAPVGFFPGRIWALRRGLAGLQKVGALGGVLGYSLLIWTWHTALLAIEYAAFNLNVSPIQFWAISIGVLTITILPVHAPLAIGTLHAAQVGLLQLFEVPIPLALATAIGIHAAMIVTVVVQGLLGTLMLAKAEWQQT